MISRVANISLESPSLGFTRCSQSAHLFRNQEDIGNVQCQTISHRCLTVFSLLYRFCSCHLFTFPSAPLLLPLLPVVSPSFLFSLLSPSSRSDGLPSPPSLSNKPPTSPGDRAGPEVRSKALVGDRQAPEGSYRQAVPRALAQPPEPGGEEDVVDRGRGPDHLPGARETGKPLG